jgi:trimeric autotransporter adhesin
MALAYNALTFGDSDTDATSYTTASISPASSATIIAAIWTQGVDLPPEPTATGNGLTWTKVDTQVGAAVRLTVFRASGASPTPGTVVFDFGGDTQQGSNWRIIEFQNANTATNDGVVQFLGTSTTNDTATITLGAFSDTDNATIGIWGSADSAGGGLNFTEGGGFTNGGQNSNTQNGTTMRVGFEYLLGNDTSVDVSVSAANDRMCGVAMEIADQLSGTTTSTSSSTSTSSTSTSTSTSSTSVSSSTSSTSTSISTSTSLSTSSTSTSTSSSTTTVIGDISRPSFIIRRYH